MTQLGIKQYGPDGTPEEIESLRNRVKILDKDTIIFHQVIKHSKFQLDVCFAEISTMVLEKRMHFLIIDLTEALRPDAETREYLRQKFHPIKDNLEHVAIYTGKNVILNIAAKFVLRGIGLEPYSLHTKHEEALAAIKNAKRK